MWPKLEDILSFKVFAALPQVNLFKNVLTMQVSQLKVVGIKRQEHRAAGPSVINSNTVVY